MNSREKQEYVWRKIIESAEISPSGLFFVDTCTLVDTMANGLPDEERVLLSRYEQVSIIHKFEEAGLIACVIPEEKPRGFWMVLSNRDHLPNFTEDIKKQLNTKNLIKVNTMSGILVVDKGTGSVILGAHKTEFNVASKEFKVLCNLATSEGCQANYDTLLGGSTSKDARRMLGFHIRDIKKKLGILPKKSTSNIDIFENIKKYGYRIRLNG